MPAAQEVSQEYRVKAAYLYNFVKYVEWPDTKGPIRICVAGQNPFGTVLEDLVRNVASRSNAHEDITWYRVEAENFESIHNHNAYAVMEKAG